MTLLAIKYCSWLLYLSLPVLDGLLPEPYLTHYSLLVAAMHILLSESVSINSLQRAEQYLLRFYEMYSSLYGESKLSGYICMYMYVLVVNLMLSVFYL